MIRQTISLITLATATLLSQAAASMPFVRINGNRFVDESGQTVVLRGVNLGNWLSLEAWMFGLDENVIRDQRTIIDTFESRFGAAEAERLLDLHRAGWMTQRDFDQIAALGFNAVRIPLWDGLIRDEDQEFALRDDAWEWTDAALAMAENAGLYVLFDMHGAPGGQSFDQPSGDVTANDLWTIDANRERLAWLWQHFARKYKNNPTFLGYDILNEPYGDFNTDHRTGLIDIAGRVHDAIREIDPDRPIVLPGAIEGIGFYGDPAARGWTGIALTEHFYPAIFDGNEQSAGTHARFWNIEAEAKAGIAADVGVPYVLGEFNPLWNSAGAPAMTATYFNEAAARGWSAFVWAHKRYKGSPGVTNNNWPIVTNAQPWSLGDITTTPKAVIEARLTELATMPLALDTALADALTGATPATPLPQTDAAPQSPPDAPPAGWFAASVGTTTAPGADATSAADGSFFGSGGDIFGSRDEFGFLGRNVSGNFGASVTITEFDTFRPFAKAGLMARASLAPDAPHIFVHAFRDGRVLVAWRAFQGGGTGQTFVSTAGFPMGIALGRQSNQWTVRVTDADGVWQSVSVGSPVTLGSNVLVGLATNSGVYEGRSIVNYEDLALLGSPTVPTPLDLTPANNSAANPSFEAPGVGTTAADWTFAGQQITRETGWTPVRSGNSLLAYRHWQVSGSGGSSLATQTIAGLTPNQRHEFSIYANADSVASNKRQADRVELQVIDTSGPSGPVVLETRTWDIGDIETDQDWSRLVLPFYPTSSSAIVRLVMFPDPDQSRRDGAVKFDDAAVAPIP